MHGTYLAMSIMHVVAILLQEVRQLYNNLAHETI